MHLLCRADPRHRFIDPVFARLRDPFQRTYDMFGRQHPMDQVAVFRDFAQDHARGDLGAGVELRRE